MNTIATRIAAALTALAATAAAPTVQAAPFFGMTLTHVVPTRTPTPTHRSRSSIHHERQFEVCFFSGVNFTGQHFCVTDQERIGYVEDAWKNRIKSVKVSGEAPNIKLCSEPSLGGKCSYIGFKKAKLNENLFNHVYSYRIR